MPDPAATDSSVVTEVPVLVIDETRELADSVLKQALFRVGETPVTVGTIVTVVLVVVLSFWLSALLRKGVEASFRRRGMEDEGTLRMVQRLLHYLIVTIALISALQTMGIDLSSLLAAGAVFAVGIGLALQGIAQNFVSGIILLVERTIRPGDVLEVGGEMVKVEEMSVRSTLVRTLDGERIVVPNSVLANDKVKNYSSRERCCRINAAVGLHYESDLRLARDVLTRMAEDLPWRSQDRPPTILLRQFGRSSVDYEVRVWIDDPWQTQPLRSELHEAIWWALKEAGLVIAYPQLDLHVDKPVLDAIQLRRAE